VVFRRPRPTRTAVTVPTSIGIGAILATTWSPVPAAIGIVLVATGLATLARYVGSSVTIGPGGIVDRGLVRTRRWSWDGVHRVCTPPRENDVNAVLLVDRHGHRYPLVGSGAVPWDRFTLERFIDAANGLATAPDPGVDGSSVRFRTAILAILAVVAALFALLLFISVTATWQSSVDPAQVPLGRTYWTSPVRAGGTYSWVDCPSLAAWASGDRDPLCGEATRAAMITSGVMIGFAGVTCAGLASVVRSRRRLQRGTPGRGSARVAVGSRDGDR
jgi:hypothetical protein